MEWTQRMNTPCLNWGMLVGVALGKLTQLLSLLYCSVERGHQSPKPMSTDSFDYFSEQWELSRILCSVPPSVSLILTCTPVPAFSFLDSLYLVKSHSWSGGPSLVWGGDLSWFWWLCHWSHNLNRLALCRKFTMKIKNKRFNRVANGIGQKSLAKLFSIRKFSFIQTETLPENVSILMTF